MDDLKDQAFLVRQNVKTWQTLWMIHSEEERSVDQSIDAVMKKLLPLKKRKMSVSDNTFKIYSEEEALLAEEIEGVIKDYILLRNGRQRFKFPLHMSKKNFEIIIKLCIGFKRETELMSQIVNNMLQQDIVDKKKDQLSEAWNKLRAFSQQF
ncbi:hypothetical protein QL285_020939 [Trifolium repens]|jgi:hypothetical protein|nr:hypothetical protein QL285_020939 [Trifolium repens]